MVPAPALFTLGAVMPSGVKPSYPHSRRLRPEKWSSSATVSLRFGGGGDRTACCQLSSLPVSEAFTCHIHAFLIC